MTGIEQFYTTAELAKLLSLRPSTIRRWIREKKIRVANFSGDYRIPYSEAERLVNEAYGAPSNDAQDVLD